MKRNARKGRNMTRHQSPDTKCNPLSEKHCTHNNATPASTTGHNGPLSTVITPDCDTVSALTQFTMSTTSCVETPDYVFGSQKSAAFTNAQVDQ